MRSHEGCTYRFAELAISGGKTVDHGLQQCKKP